MTHQPPFHELPEVPGCPGVRWVSTTMMTEDQYRGEGWHVRTVGSYDYWVAWWQFLLRRSDDRASRIAAAGDRREEDEASWGAFHSPPRRLRSPHGEER